MEFAAEGNLSYEGCGFNAGDGPDALENRREKSGVKVLASEAVVGDGHAADEDVVGAEAEGNVAQCVDGAQEESAGDEEDEGEGDLGDDEE